MTEDLKQQVRDELARILELPAAEQPVALEQLRQLLENQLNQNDQVN